MATSLTDQESKSVTYLTFLQSAACGAAVNGVGSECALPGASRVYAFDATVVPQGSIAYLTLWPDGENQK